MRVLASDSLRREAEHKLATQTLQLRAVEKDCEELSVKLASTAARLSACEAELREAKQETAVADVARQAAEELAEERGMEVSTLRRQLSNIPDTDVQRRATGATMRGTERMTAEDTHAQRQEKENQVQDADYTSKDPLLRCAIHTFVVS